MTVTRTLLSLLEKLRDAGSLEATMQDVVAATAAMLDVERATIRVFDDTGAELLVAARVGEPMHEKAQFVPGEGLVGWVAANRKSLRVGSAEQDERFVHREGARGVLGSFLGAPLLEATACIGVLAVVHERSFRFTEDDEQLLALIAAATTPHLSVARIRRLSELDPLTSVLNRRGLEASLSAMPLPSAGPPHSVAIVDIDHFKRVNDDFGHGIGDQALTAIARSLALQLRRGDLIARLGGEEFVLVLHDASLADASRIAERAREAIAAEPLSTDAGPISLTVSIGLAEPAPGEAWDAVLRRADAALYRAKQGGRNRVEQSDRATE